MPFNTSTNRKFFKFNSTDPHFGKPYERLTRITLNNPSTLYISNVLHSMQLEV